MTCPNARLTLRPGNAVGLKLSPTKPAQVKMAIVTGLAQSVTEARVQEIAAQQDTVEVFDYHSLVQLALGV